MKDGIVINADVNGALNILRKHLNVSSKEIIPLEYIGVVMAPRRVRISELRPRRKACKIFNAIARI
jgi:transposase